MKPSPRTHRGDATAYSRTSSIRTNSDAFQGFAVFRLTPALGLSSHLPSSAHALTMLTMSYRQFETLTIEGSAESLLDSAMTKEMGQRRAFTMSKNNPAARRIDSLPK